MCVEPRKMVQMNRFAGQKLRHRCREQMYGHQGGKAVAGSVWGVMNWVIGIDMYTLMCIKLMTNKNLLYKKINKIKLKIIEKRNRQSQSLVLVFRIIVTYEGLVNESGKEEVF